MSITLMSASSGYTLDRAADGKLSVKEQTENFGTAVTNDLLGIFNGGRTGAVGLAHTVSDLVKVAGGAVAEGRLKTGSFSIPFVRGG